MKNVLRDWLGINEEKFALEVQLKKLQQKLDYLDASYADVDDKVDNLDSEVNDMKYEVEDKPTYSEAEELVRDLAYCDIEYVKSDLEDEMDYSEITDNVFDLVMQEIENRDTLQELVEHKLEALTEEGRNNTGAYPDITEIVEDVVEELINKLRG
jgi:vacuolar-type H+-ATPase subunit I/STV1